MKTTALCVILILTLLCHRGYSKSLTTLNDVTPDETHLQNEETSVQEAVFRAKRHTILHICNFCCKCCKHKGCGYCCLT